MLDLGVIYNRTLRKETIKHFLQSYVQNHSKIPIQ